ncbi:MAG TPA: hypothetical protein VK660_04295 [Xanthomonadaceae bacterium]|jgi:hypothetical protein|nr:hypothetical protein [Xanthomonadaceae bacterium]
MIRPKYGSYFKIPGFFFIAQRELQADSTPAELSDRYNKLTDDEQSFLNSQGS